MENTPAFTRLEQAKEKYNSAKKDIDAIEENIPTVKSQAKREIIVAIMGEALCEYIRHEKCNTTVSFLGNLVVQYDCKFSR